MRKRDYEIMPQIHSIEDGYKALGAAICAQAIRDYTSGPLKERAPAKAFILSSDFVLLSGGMSGEEVIQILDRQIRDGRD